jgi:spore germination protein KC
MKKKANLCVFGVIFLSLFSFSGCSKQRGLENKLIVEGLGIDLEAAKYVVSAHIFDADASENQAEGKVKIIKTEGKTVFDALSNIVGQTGENLLYSHNFLVIIGEEAAKNGVNDIFDFLVRHHEIKPSVSVFCAKGKASEVFKAKSGGKDVTSRDIQDLSKTDALDAGEIGSNILKFVGALKNKTADPKALALKMEKNGEDDVIKLGGMAIFSEDKLAGYLDLEETISILMLKYNLKNFEGTVNIENIGNVGYRIKDSKSETKVRFEDGVPVFDIFIGLKVNIMEISGTQNLLDKNEQSLLETALEKKLGSNARANLKKTIDYNSDVLFLGQRILQTSSDYLGPNEKKMKEIAHMAQFNIETRLKILA